ncbi:MAG: SBBP repeat-containing protein [Promethearchaeota archaeon]
MNKIEKILYTNVRLGIGRVILGGWLLLVILISVTPLIVNLTTLASNSPLVTENEQIDTLTPSFSFLNQLTSQFTSSGKRTTYSAGINTVFPFTGFIQNQGQLSDESIHYYYSSSGMKMSFSPSRINVGILSSVKNTMIQFSITFPGSESVTPIGKDQQSHSLNYFYGDSQFTNIVCWNEIWYYGLYPDIDLHYYISAQGLKYDFIVHPGANPDLITLQVSDSMKLSVEGSNVSMQPYKRLNDISFQDTALHVFQADGMEISAQFISKTSHQLSYGFKICSFDPTQTLIIDPLVLVFSTYIGGSDFDGGTGIKVDNSDNVYIAGWTSSSDFPTQNAFNNTHSGGTDVFVAKFDATGNNLVFSTFIGGLSNEEPYDIALDANGNVYITGFTESGNFPVKNAYQGSHSGSKEVFITKLNSTGNGLLFSTFLGGSNDDWAYGIAVDGVGNCYVTGSTDSTNFPTFNAYQSSYGGAPDDAFVTKLNATGSLNYSTYLGGFAQEWGDSIAVDATGNSYITGYTTSSNFPTMNAYDNTLDGSKDAFITKLNATGNGLNYSTYLGGSDSDNGIGIAIDTARNAYIFGDTLSDNFPMKNAFNNTYSGTKDAFVTKLNATGNGLNFSTYLGGNNVDSPQSITVDLAGNSYITGSTYSSNFPTYNAYDSTLDGTFDAFLTKLNATGTGLSFSTYLGGTASDWGQAVAMGPNGDCFITGSTSSSDFPTDYAYDNTLSGSTDVFITRFSGRPSIVLRNPTNNSVHPSGITVDLDVTAIDGVSKVRYNWDGSANMTLESPYDATLPAGESQHILSVHANDTFDRWTKRVFIFTTDDTAPSIELTSPVNGTTLPSGTIIDLSITDLNGISRVLFSWDGNTNGTLASPYDLPLITEDSLHNLWVYANDSADNWVAAYYEFTTDDTSPTITLVNPTNGTSAFAGTVIDFTFADFNGVNQVFYSWDGDPNATLVTPYELFFPATLGQHILKVYAQDTVGNWAVKTYVFTTTDTTTTTTTTDTTTTTTTSTDGVPTPFFTIEVGLIALVFFIVLFRRRKKHMRE